MNSLPTKNGTLDLFHHFENPITYFSILIKWDSIDIYKRNFLGLKTKKNTEDIDLEPTCVMFDQNEQMLDSVSSSKFNSWSIRNGFPLGKNNSKDMAIRINVDHKSNPNQRIVKTALQEVDDNTQSIFYYLNFDLRKIKSPDFSTVKSLQMICFADSELKNIVLEKNIKTEDFRKERWYFGFGKTFKRK
ncbi:hypothetical protein [Chryseobacterium sp.]|uniref:hypothetical protein n=1 Tax=Chryseobacterium sp. TaxID=1871047 RepID=UPI0028989F2D|nr:hypothetical protein [Chryseobacterium sp.]